MIVSKQAFDRVQKEVSERNPGEKIASFAPKLPVAADVLDRYNAKQVNEELQRDFVRVANATSSFKKGEIVPVKEFDSLKAERQSDIDKLEEEARQLNEKEPPDPLGARRKQEEADRLKGLLPKSEAPTPMEGAVQFQTLTLVPAVRFVMPLVLGALALWFSWRLVNLPPFADFLIATEAELNKVSWTPRRRLVQDTIVVLVTTLLITFFLLFADLIWSQLLTRVGVLRAPKETSADVRPGGDDLPDW